MLRRRSELQRNVLHAVDGPEQLRRLRQCVLGERTLRRWQLSRDVYQDGGRMRARRRRGGRSAIAAGMTIGLRPEARLQVPGVTRRKQPAATPVS
jgi:hypothetical protein